MLRSLANYLSFAFAGLFLLVGVAVMHSWPASFWLDVRTVRVFDSKVGEPVLMAVDRTISRDFRGEWLVSIRKLGYGGWVQFCSARGKTNYSADSHLPDPLTLRWWSYPECNPLPPGKYVMRTTWTIHGASFLPEKDVTADSNIFEVKP